MARKSKSLLKILHLKKLLIGFALVLLFLVGAQGVALAADKGKPGDILFPVDRLLENLQATFTSDPIDRAEQELKMADERQKEAEQLVIESGSNRCAQDGTGTLDPNLVGNVSRALTLFSNSLVEAEARAAQVRNNTRAHEDIMAAIAEINLKHLLVWESLGNITPEELSGVLTSAVSVMDEATQRALTNLPEGRQSDLATRAQTDTAALSQSLASLLSNCDTDTFSSTAGGGSGSGGSTSTTTGTSQTQSGSGTITRETVSTTTRTILEQIENPSSTPTTSNPNPTGSPILPSNQLDVSVGSDDANVGIDLNPENLNLDLSPNDGDGIGVGGNPDINLEENTTGCNGVQLFGVCVGL